MKRTRRGWLELSGWLLLLVVVTGVLWLLRNQLDKAHMALAYLLLVLFGSSRSGRSIGIGLAVLCFLSFNFFLLPPHYTFIVQEPLDWLVLVSFLLTAVVGAELLDRAQRQARQAEERAEEIDRLSTLGAETLNAGRAEEAVTAIAAMVRGTLDLASCEIHGPIGDAFHCIGLSRRDGALEPRHAAVDTLTADVLAGRGAAVQSVQGSPLLDDTTPVSVTELIARHPSARVLVLPLRVRGRPVGMLRLEHENALRLDLPQRRFADALSYYAALGVERFRLLADAERVEALREADRLKDALMAAVSHDLRTPLTTIKALGHEMLRDGDERAAIVVEEADRLNRIVSDLLDLSRLNSGGVPLRLELNPADDLLTAAVQQTSGVLGSHALRVKMPDEDILVGRFDAVHAVRVLTNLVQNAAQYSPPGAPIDVTLTRNGEWLQVLVEDRGAGIAETDLDRIFEPFARLPGSPDEAGTGLGLTIARALARAMGGDVKYEPRQGGGSRFLLALPAADLPLGDEALPDQGAARNAD